MIRWFPIKGQVHNRSDNTNTPTTVSCRSCRYVGIVETYRSSCMLFKGQVESENPICDALTSHTTYPCMYDEAESQEEEKGSL